MAVLQTSAKPKLRDIAPLTNFVCWGYAITNIVLGFGLYLLYSTPIPIADVNIFSYQVWGIIYFLIGVVTVYGLLSNNWRVTRQAQIAGLAVKTCWLTALILRSFIAPQTIVITAVWFLFAYIQAGVYIYFLPARDVHGHN